VKVQVSVTFSMQHDLYACNIIYTHIFKTRLISSPTHIDYLRKDYTQNISQIYILFYLLILPKIKLHIHHSDDSYNVGK
jgi:hypothetical protein